MNLIIELDERLLTSIAERCVLTSLKVNEYGVQPALVEYVQDQTKSATMEYLKGIDWKVMVHAIAAERVESITRDVVTKEIEKYVRRVVKDMKEKGELV